LQRFSVLRNIQPLQFVLTRYAERHEQGDQFEQDEAHARGPDEGDDDPVEADQHLLRMTIDQAGRAPIALVAKTSARTRLWGSRTISV